MQCPKCCGLVIDEYNVELRVTMKRCLLCGLYPKRKILAVKCKYANCQRIPVHGTICVEHIAMIERHRHARLAKQAKARQREKEAL